ncbi:response regulator transcription factor [Paraburkholderia dinghuensis]|uniref:DNA-binding response regulator n=1 Tax=Paraburkholderia dinghuensis TaxID=2305225 RepID=A0A3N6NDP9_9BURK|nr:response regulator transcription factor [Paraburkholderia dinghuensis]RQH07122.1 DNA-binding response regulator [Paraburkholderia dinghuensis]
MKIKVVLADQHPVVIVGLSYFLSNINTIDVIGEAGSPDEIPRLVSGGGCDVLVTGLLSSGGIKGGGLRLIEDIRRQFPDLKIVVFTMIRNHAITKQLLKLGVRSVINKSDQIDHLIIAIHTVYAGAVYFPAAGDAMSNAAGRISVAGSKSQELSQREMEVIRLIASGMSITEIAEYKHRAVQTVSAQKIKAMKKLGVSSEAELYQYAFESGMLHPTISEM